MAYSDLIGSDQQAIVSQQARAARRTLVLQIAALGLIALAVPLYLIFAQLSADLTHSASELMEAQARLAALNTPSPEVQQLTTQVAQTEALLATLAAAPPPVGMTWPQIAGAIGGYDPHKIALVTLTESDDRITLEGRATDNAAVVAYIQSLAASPLFLDIERQSVETVATPNTALNAASTTSPTASAGSSAETRPVRFVLNLVVNQL